MATPLTRKDWLIKCEKLAKVYEDAMTNPKHTSSDLVERLREQAYTITHMEAADRIEALEAKNERLRGVLEAVWKEATTMRNASKLVGPYPKEPANNRVWARSMYHAGRKLHALIKPVRAALGEKQ